MVARRLRRQGTDPLGQGRPARAHLQSIVVSPRGLRARAAPDGHERSHVGTGDREHAVLSASHVSDALSHRSSRAVLLRRDDDDPVGGRDDIRRSGWRTTPPRASTSSTIPTFPIAVFLGMHLLFTDPSTSPRTELGRVIFGALYGLSTIALYQVLGTMGLPTFLRQAAAGAGAEPVDQADRSLRAVASVAGTRSRDRSARHSAPHRRHLAYMSVWAIVFTAHERGARRRRRSPGTVASVLAAGLRERTAVRLPLSRGRAGGVL